MIAGGCRAWCWRHSLSIALTVCFVVSTLASGWVEHGTWIYDFLMMLAGSFGGSLVIVVFARYFWEKNSDPTKPTEK